MRIDFPKVVGTIEIYMDVMRAICGNTDGRSLIDLGCCFAPNTPKLGFKKRCYVDVVDRKLDDPKEQHLFVKNDILKINPITWGDYDVAIASDVIEHLFPEDGYKLMGIMYMISQVQIIFTPLDNIFGIATVDQKDDPEMHRSLWCPDMFYEWASIVFPDYHKVHGGGAFFTFMTPSPKYDFDRVVAELKTKSWAK